jgi:hypothetical protein
MSDADSNSTDESVENDADCWACHREIDNSTMKKMCNLCGSVTCKICMLTHKFKQCIECYNIFCAKCGKQCDKCFERNVCYDYCLMRCIMCNKKICKKCYYNCDFIDALDDEYNYWGLCLSHKLTKNMLVRGNVVFAYIFKNKKLLSVTCMFSNDDSNSYSHYVTNDGLVKLIQFIL